MESKMAPPEWRVFWFEVQIVSSGIRPEYWILVGVCDVTADAPPPKITFSMRTYLNIRNIWAALFRFKIRRCEQKWQQTPWLVSRFRSLINKQTKCLCVGLCRIWATRTWRETCTSSPRSSEPVSQACSVSHDSDRKSEGFGWDLTMKKYF